MRSGIFLIDKHPGVSSAQIVGALKKRFKPDKIGHAGTLDPMATGLLVCMVGKATRLSDYALGGDKRYQGVIRLGLETDSDDITGQVLKEGAVECDDGAIAREVQKLTGAIEQIPPKVSAIKIGGERAYKLARAGEAVEIEARSVQIHRFDWERISLNELSYDVRCSKGTYIRSLARDLGAALGCGGTLASIRRVESSPFSVENAKKVDEIQLEDMLSWEKVFPQSLRLNLSRREIDQLSGGDQSCVQVTMQRAAQTGQFAQNPSTGVPSTAIYCDGESRRPMGLFFREGSRWKLGLHVGE